MLGNISMAQEIPTCIKNLNTANTLTTTKFVRTINLKGNRIVYEFAIVSKRQCMDCPNGTVFYDSNCNQIASFIMGRGSSVYIRYGYTAFELGKTGGYPNIKYLEKFEPAPSCIAKAVDNVDSLNRVGVTRVLQVRIKDKTLYHFEHAIAKEKVNCKDCSNTFKYYDENCNLAATFTVGGIAGAKASEGFTSSDFYNKRTIQILWNKN
ncbi:hypothetical protein SAMN06297358_1467 [Pedobacter xixiisoli]|uniref:Uncharacterized protein n=2 Tax=Pedobacter xixiisoli TaxID=1476464 RepID=A0A285ZX55_9SPHI|nr:hypothetical protein SAMN06297358_1467 [Pedobacter xixiisoli]